MEETYVEALNSCSLESYEAYFEELRSKGQLTEEQLRSVEGLPIAAKMTSYACAILACAKCTGEAKAYAMELLRLWA